VNPSRVEVRDLMERIRKRVRSAASDEWPAPTEDRPPLAGSRNLAHLNRHWVIEDPVQAATPTPRKMLRALVPQRLRQSVKRVFRDFVFASLEPYLLEEREFLAHLVKLLNETATRVDAIEKEYREIAERGGQTRSRLFGDLEALRMRAEELHEAIERRLDGGAPPPVARGRSR
jgi:hypothetical protein